MKTTLDEIDRWLADSFGIIPGACSSTDSLRYSVARRVAEALWPKAQLSDELERAAERSAFLQYEMSTDIDESMRVISARIIHEIGFKAGAQWQKEQMMKEAVDGFIFQAEEYYPKELIARYDGGLKMGDKVKIIILPEEEQ